MSKNIALAELLNLNIEIKSKQKLYVQKVVVLPNNFTHNKELCRLYGIEDMYREPPVSYAVRSKYASHWIYAWCKNESDSQYSFRSIFPTVKECEVLAPIVRKVQYINSIIDSQRSFAINKYVDSFMKETQIFVEKLIAEVNQDCLNPWDNFHKAKEEEKALRKMKKKKIDEAKSN